MARMPRVGSLAGIVGAVAAVLVLVVVLSQNIEYFRTVSEAVANRHDTSQFRMAGAVVNGSVVPTADGVDFRMTGSLRTVVVSANGFLSCGSR